MRKVFLEELPHGGKNISKDKVNWIESIGLKINFIYDDIKGCFIIKNYNTEKVFITIEYQQKDYELFVGDLTSGRFAFVIGKRVKTHILEVNDLVDTNSGKIKILEKIFKEIESKNKKSYKIRSYKWKCCNCGYINTSTEYHIKEGLGCPVCNGGNNKIKIGVNDMWTTAPDVSRLLANPDDGYRFSKQSNKKIDWICPNCGEVIKKITVSSVYSKGLSCPHCSDGISYPNKLAYSVLMQLPIDFKNEYSPKWAKPFKYDFYFILKGNKYILEMDGAWHYIDNHLSGKSKEESIRIDQLKEKIANQNGVKVIRIDCRLSELNYIKQNILNSDLAKIFDLSNVNWDLAQEYSNGSIVKMACELWNNGMQSTTKIGESLMIAQCTVLRYLKIGAKMNWCNYSVSYVRNNHLDILAKKRKKKVICITLNKIFESIQNAEKELGVHNSNISSCCKGKSKTAGGYHWMYYEDYLKLHNDSQDLKEVI